MSVSLRLAVLLMKWGNKRDLFGAQVLNTPIFITTQCDPIGIATRRAFVDGPSFFQRFERTFYAQHVAGRDVLDIVSGCGGRTAYYLLHGNPHSIVGLAISTLRASIARRSVEQLCGDSRIRFTVGVGEKLPFRDASFDFVFSYDVFERVENLEHGLRECYRVLKPGGRLCALFPPYYGPRAHHLDFITTLPFLRHVFRRPYWLTLRIKYCESTPP